MERLAIESGPKARSYSEPQQLSRQRRRSPASRSRRTTTRSSSPSRWRGRRRAARAIAPTRSGGSRSPRRSAASVFFAAVAVHPRRARDRAARHPRQPPDRRRSRRRTISGICASAARYWTLLLLDTVGLPDGGRSRSSASPAAAAADPARTLWLLALPGPVPAVHRQHVSGEPLPRPGRARSWRCSPAIAVLEIWPAASRSRRDRAVRRRGQPWPRLESLRDRRLHPSDRHADAGARASSRRTCPAGATILTQPYSVPLEPTAEVAARGGGAVRTRDADQDARSRSRGPLSRSRVSADLPRAAAWTPTSSTCRWSARQLSRCGRSAREHVAFVVLKRYNDEAPATMPLLTAAGPGRAAVSPCFRPIHAPPAPTERRGSSLSCTTRMPGSRRRSSAPVRSWRSGRSYRWSWFVNCAIDSTTTARALPLARHAWARYRRRKYEGRDPALPRRRHRPRRPPADGRRLRSDDAVQPALRVLLRRRPAQHRRRVAAGADARRAGEGVPRAERTSRSA